MSADESTLAPRPPLRVVRGEPSPEELAALVTVLAARAATAAAGAGAPAGGGGGEPAPGRAGWNDRSRLVRRPLTPGRGYRSSALPG